LFPQKDKVENYHHFQPVFMYHFHKTNHSHLYVFVPSLLGTMVQRSRGYPSKLKLNDTIIKIFKSELIWADGIELGGFRTFKCHYKTNISMDGSRIIASIQQARQNRPLARYTITNYPTLSVITPDVPIAGPTEFNI